MNKVKFANTQVRADVRIVYPLVLFVPKKFSRELEYVFIELNRFVSPPPLPFRYSRG